MSADVPTYCAVHPDKETALQCNKCGRYMCAKCAVSTPVGYRCRECVRGHDKQFFQGTSLDGAKIFALTAVLGGFAAWLLGFGGVFLAVVFGLPAGAFIGELALRLTRGRRGRYDDLIGVAGVVVGGLVGALLPPVLQMLQLVNNPDFAAVVEGLGTSPTQYVLSIIRPETLVWALIPVVILTVGVYGRMRIRRR